MHKVNIIKLIADPSRWALLSLLKSGPRPVSELTAGSRLSQSLVSHHLQSLRIGKLVTGVRSGRQVSYRLTNEGRRVTTVLEQI